MSAWISNLDYSLIQQATSLTASSPLLTFLVYAAAQLLIFIFPLALFILWRRPEIRGQHHGARKAVVIALVGVVIALAIKELVSFAYFRPRPSITYPSLSVLPFRVDLESFPSAHTMLSFVIATSLLFSGYRRLGWFLIFCAVLIALGRVFSGVHYPSDVVGGAVIGIMASWYLHREASSLKRYLPDR